MQFIATVEARPSLTARSGLSRTKLSGLTIGVDTLERAYSFLPQTSRIRFRSHR